MLNSIRKWLSAPELERVKQELTHTQKACGLLQSDRDALQEMLNSMEAAKDAQRKEIDGLNTERNEVVEEAAFKINDQRKKIDTLLQSVTERDIEIASLNESVGKLKMAVNSAAQFVADELDDEAAEALVVFCERLEKQSA